MFLIKNGLDLYGQMIMAEINFVILQLSEKHACSRSVVKRGSKADSWRENRSTADPGKVSFPNTVCIPWGTLVKKDLIKIKQIYLFPFSYVADYSFIQKMYTLSLVERLIFYFIKNKVFLFTKWLIIFLTIIHLESA